MRSLSIQFELPPWDDLPFRSRLRQKEVSLPSPAPAFTSVVLLRLGSRLPVIVPLPGTDARFCGNFRICIFATYDLHALFASGRDRNLLRRCSLDETERCRKVVHLFQPYDNSISDVQLDCRQTDARDMLLHVVLGTSKFTFSYAHSHEASSLRSCTICRINFNSIGFLSSISELVPVTASCFNLVN